MAAVGDVELPVYHRVERSEVLRVSILGLIVGLLIPGLGFLISNWIISPIFCRPDSAFAVCATGGLVGYYIAAVLVSVTAVAILANWGVYRPLIIALAAMLALWGLKHYLDPLTGNTWIEYYVTSALLFAGVYLLFYWLMRVRSFAASIILAVVAVVVLRWVLLI